MPPKRREYEQPSSRLPIATTSADISRLASIATERRPYYRESRLQANTADEIIPGVWLGFEDSIINPELSGQHNYQRIDVPEGGVYEKTIRSISAEKGPVFVRGGKAAEAVVIAAIIEIYGVSPEDAYAYTKFRREVIRSTDVGDVHTPKASPRSPRSPRSPQSPKASPRGPKKPSPKKPSPKKPSPKKPSPKGSPPKTGTLPEDYLTALLKCVSARRPESAAYLAPILERYYIQIKPLILKELSAYVDVRKAANPDDKGVIGYINAIKAIRGSDVPLISLKVAKAIKIKGVGDATIEKIGMILEKGHLPSSEERKDHYSKTALLLAKLEAFGIGPAPRKKLIDLGLGSPSKLRDAYASGRTDLPKLNAVQLYKLGNYSVPPKTISPDEGRKVWKTFGKLLSTLEGMEGMYLAGDLRRGKTSSEVEVMVVTDEVTTAQVASHLKKKKLDVLSKGVTCYVAYSYGDVPLVVEISISSKAMAGFNLHRLTGPSTYHSEVVSTLKKNGVIIDHGVTYTYDPISDVKTLKPFYEEEEIYDFVGRLYVEPEERK